MADLFDIISAITSKKGFDYLDTLEPEDRKKWSSFMCIRFLSMDSNLVTLVNEFQPLVGKISEEEMFKFLYKVIPSGYYDLKHKGKKTKSEDAEVALKEYISKVCEVSTKEATEYINTLTKPQLAEVMNSSNLSDTHIKHLKTIFNVK